MIEARTTEADMKRGDRVRTCYGEIETVMAVEEFRIITYESARQLAWYHPSKVFPVKD